MKKEISPVVIGIVVVLLVAALGWGFMSMNNGQGSGPKPDEIPKRPSPEELRKLREGEKRGAGAPPSVGGANDRRGAQ